MKNQSYVGDLQDLGPYPQRTLKPYVFPWGDKMEEFSSNASDITHECYVCP